MTLPFTKNMTESIEKKWNPKADTSFYVIDRKNGGIIAKYKVSIFG